METYVYKVKMPRHSSQLSLLLFPDFQYKMVQLYCPAKKFAQIRFDILQKTIDLQSTEKPLIIWN